jgi:hypothetical protein
MITAAIATDALKLPAGLSCRIAILRLPFDMLIAHSMRFPSRCATRSGGTGLSLDRV